MVDLPSGPISVWPPGSGARVLRSWARDYALQYGLTYRPEVDPPAAQAFRHALVASATYLEAYNVYRYRYPPEVADRYATARTLQLGNLSELAGPNPVPKHLMDYWNNYEGVRLAREIAATEGPDITNDRLAQIVAGEINASIQAPFGKSRFILFNGYDQQGVDFKDPRLEIDRYDVDRLPNEGWGIAPFPKAEGHIPPAIIGAFPKLYNSPPQPPRAAPQSGGEEPQDVPDPTLNQPASPQEDGGKRGDNWDGNNASTFGQTASAAALGDKVSAEDSIVGGQPPVQQEQPISMFADLIPQPSGPQLTSGTQHRPYQQVALSATPGLPQQVIDTGNYLRVNGYEITPRTMYVSHVLGPQAAVDLFKRTGSTGSPAVPSPDAATGDQMRAWVRALRLGPAALAGLVGALAPAPAAEAATRGQPDDNALAANRPFA